MGQLFFHAKKKQLALLSLYPGSRFESHWRQLNVLKSLLKTFVVG